MKEKPTVGYPFFWAFPSDRIPKATKGVNIHFFIHNFPEIPLRQRFQYITHEFSEDFEATAYLLACVRELLAYTNILRGYMARIFLGKRLMILLSKILYCFSLNSLSSSSSYICHGVGLLFDPLRSHASRSLFKGLP